MRAGALDRLITITSATNSYGDPDEYGIVPTFSAQLVPMRAELLEAMADDSEHASGRLTKTLLSFRLRFLENVKPGDKLTYDGRDFEIRTVKEIGRRKSLELVAVETGAP